MLRTTLLANIKKEIKTELDLQREHIDETGCTLVCNGWTDRSGRALLNFLIVTPKGCKFLHAVDTGTETKDSAYIAAKICEALETVGPKRVVQICMDSAAVNVAAMDVVREKYPHISHTPCTAYSLGLLLEDIGKLDWMVDVLKQTKEVISFLTNHHKSIAVFMTKSNLALRKPV